LDVNSLIRDENERKTAIGLEFLNMVAAGKIIPAEMIVRMLRKIIYAGDGLNTMYILSSFPDIIEQAKEFEKGCATISAIIYASQDDAVVEIKNNNLTLFNIDALFQKEFRLRTIKQWDVGQFSQILAPSVEWHLVFGKPLSGKTTVAALMARSLGFKLLDFKAFEEQIRKAKSTEEEQFEGEIGYAELCLAVADFVKGELNAGKKHAYVLDGLWTQEANQGYIFM